MILVRINSPFPPSVWYCCHPSDIDHTYFMISQRWALKTAFIPQFAKLNLFIGLLSFEDHSRLLSDGRFGAMKTISAKTHRIWGVNVRFVRRIRILAMWCFHSLTKNNILKFWVKISFQNCLKLSGRKFKWFFLLARNV